MADKIIGARCVLNRKSLQTRAYGMKIDWVGQWFEGYCLVGGGGGYSSVACLSHLTIDHASLSRRSTVPTPNRDTSNI